MTDPDEKVERQATTRPIEKKKKKVRPPPSAGSFGWAIESPCFFCMLYHNVITVITQHVLPQQDGAAMEKQLRSRDVKLVPIGNSQGVRIPKALLEKYDLSNSLVLEETDQGILLRKKREDKLSWEDTFKAMAEEGEDWTDLDATLLDGLEEEGIDAIYFADLKPTMSSEISKVRPVVIVSQDAMNQYLETVVVCPLTSKRHPKWRSRFSNSRPPGKGAMHHELGSEFS